MHGGEDGVRCFARMTNENADVVLEARYIPIEEIISKLDRDRDIDKFS
jgi:hypothetical protein